MKDKKLAQADNAECQQPNLSAIKPRVIVPAYLKPFVANTSPMGRRPMIVAPP